MVNIPQTSDFVQMFRSPTYEAVSENENQHESCKDMDAEEWSTSRPLKRKTFWSREKLYYILFAVAFAIYSFLLAQYWPRTVSDVECAKQTSVYSPMHEAVEFVEYDFHHDFDVQSEYRGPPTPELEAAWEKLWNFDPVAFPEDKLSAVNRTGGLRYGDEKLARLGDAKVDVTEDERGAVAANFEVFHQIHCLNYLRQYTWRDWYFNHPDKVIIPQDMLASDVGVRIHADHCIDLLRTTLMCHGDTTPFFTIIDPEQSMGARGDFSAHHKCKNFEKLQQWNRDNGVEFGSFDPEDQ